MVRLVELPWPGGCGLSGGCSVEGVSGRAMLRALIAGERDPDTLAELARGKLRSKIPLLRQALRGRFNAHHAVMLSVILDHVEYLERAIAALDVEVDRVIAPFSEARDRLDTITGVGKRGSRWLGEILPECAAAASQCRKTYLAAQYWRLRRRMGHRKAAVAVGHSILVICWHLLTNDCDYEDLGGDWFVTRTDTDKRRDHLIRQLQDLGYGVRLTKVA
jgi:transposase